MDMRVINGLSRVRPSRCICHRMVAATDLAFTVQRRDPVRACRFSHDGQYVASTCGDREIIIVRNMRAV